MLAALPATRIIILVVCVGIAFVLGRIVNYRRIKEHEKSEDDETHG